MSDSHENKIEENTPNQEWPAIPKYIRENPFTTLSMSSLIFGGSILLIYFYSINFLPEIDSTLSFTLFYSVSILGMLFIIMLLFLMMLALLPTSIIWESNKITKQQKEDAVYYSACVSSIIVLTLGVFIVFFKFNLYCYVAFAFIILLVSCFFLIKRFPQSKSKIQLSKNPNPIRTFLTCFFQTLLSCFSSIFITMMDFPRKIHELGNNVYLSMAFIAFTVIWLSIFATVEKTLRLFILIPLGLISIFLILSQSQSLHHPALFAIKKLQLGELGMTRIVLSGDGCKQFNRALGIKYCNETENNGPTAICPVFLRSRIGSQVLIEIPHFKYDEENNKFESIGNPKKRVILNKSTLLAWIKIEDTIKQNNLNNSSAEEKEKNKKLTQKEIAQKFCEQDPPVNHLTPTTPTVSVTFQGFPSNSTSSVTIGNNVNTYKDTDAKDIHNHAKQ